MLKRALGETGDESKPAEEDKHSHHSDSVMECRRAPRPIGTSCTFLSTFSSFHVSSSFHEPYFPRRRDVMLLPYTDKPGVDRPPRTRSLSPSPPPVRPSSQSMLEGAPIPDTRQHTAQRRHDKLRPFQDQRRKSQVRQRLDIAYSFVNCWSLNSIFCPGLGFWVLWNYYLGKESVLVFAVFVVYCSDVVFLVLASRWWLKLMRQSWRTWTSSRE